MPDEEIAESSPAETKAPTPEPQAPENQEAEGQGIFDPEKTVKAEEVEKPATSETPDPDKEGESVSPPEGAERPEETGDQQPKAEKRIKQLTAQIKALERRMNESQQPQAQQPRLKEPLRPKADSFDTIEDYDKAFDKYVTDLQAYTIEQDRIQQQQETRKAEAAKKQEKLREQWQKRELRVKKTNPEFDAMKAVEIVQPNLTTDGFLGWSEYGPEVLDYFLNNPDEAERVRELDPYSTMRELLAIEAKISDQAKGIKAKPKEAPKPPGYVSGKPSAPAVPKRAADILYG